MTENNQTNEENMNVEKENGITISPYLEKEAIAHSAPNETILLTSLKAPEVQNIARESRAPIDLVAVIDKSGSMSGAKLDLVLKTMLFVVDQLKEKDQLCIVAYDTQVEVCLPMTSMDLQGKEMAKTIISKIKPGSSTNMSGGLLKAIDQIVARKVKNEVVSVMLFTDGLANVGIIKIPDIVKAVQTSLQKIDSACSIFTFGYGTDHDQNMLREIAESGKGLYYFIETLDDIPKSFGDCLGGLLSVVAQNIFLTLEGLDGISVKKVLNRIKGHENTSGQKVEINLGDIYSEEIRDIVVMLNIPATESANTEFTPAVNITLKYFNVTTNQQEQRVATAYLKRPAETPADQPINMNIDRQRNRLTVSEAMELASLINRGDKDARGRAREILEAAVKSIKQSATAEDKLCLALINDLQESIRDLDDYSTDYVSVQKKMFSKGGAHTRQRGHTSMYENTTKSITKTNACTSTGRTPPSSGNSGNNSSNSGNNIP